MQDDATVSGGVEWSECGSWPLPGSVLRGKGKGAPFPVAISVWRRATEYFGVLGFHTGPLNGLELGLSEPYYTLSVRACEQRSPRDSLSPK